MKIVIEKATIRKVALRFESEDEIKEFRRNLAKICKCGIHQIEFIKRELTKTSDNFNNGLGD